ncbi:MAG: DedA family protein [Ichthyobacteriaceae bacterium]|nr:DedA family protein [Ichthyobacteriaceae bacterium]
MINDIINYFAQFGLTGLFTASFLAGSVLPLGSEVLYTILYFKDIDPWLLLIVASTGNWLGSMTNYWIGTHGKWQWITKYLKVPQKKVEKHFTYIHKYDYYMALLCWLPIIGTPIAIALGFLRSDVKRVTVLMFVGKFLRYSVLSLLLYFYN